MTTDTPNEYFPQLSSSSNMFRGHSRLVASYRCILIYLVFYMIFLWGSFEAVDKPLKPVNSDSGVLIILIFITFILLRMFLVLEMATVVQRHRNKVMEWISAAQIILSFVVTCQPGLLRSQQYSLLVNNVFGARCILQLKDI